MDTSYNIDSVAADGTGAIDTLYSNSADTFYSPTSSPDGKSLAYTALVPPGTDTQLFVNGQAISGNEDVFAFPAPWVSNDTLIYASNGKIWRRNVVSGAVTRFRSRRKCRSVAPSYPLKSHDFHSTETQPVTGILDPVLSPDGRHVALVALNQLWEMTIGHKPHEADQRSCMTRPGPDLVAGRTVIGLRD